MASWLDMPLVLRGASTDEDGVASQKKEKSELESRLELEAGCLEQAENRKKV